MFTGIIETFTPVLEKTEYSLTIARPSIFEKLTIGQSIAVNGACLSVARADEVSIGFDVLSETFRKTNLGDAKSVNLERAMRSDGRFEGHIVLGHVDTTIQLLKKNIEKSGIEAVFSLPSQKQYLVEKGSISLNGISLTIGNITEESFSVFLIPLTLEHTNMGNLNLGDLINVEYDYLAKLLITSRNSK